MRATLAADLVRTRRDDRSESPPPGRRPRLVEHHPMRHRKPPHARLLQGRRAFVLPGLGGLAGRTHCQGSPAGGGVPAQSRCLSRRPIFPTSYWGMQDPPILECHTVHYIIALPEAQWVPPNVRFIVDDIEQEGLSSARREYCIGKLVSPLQIQRRLRQKLPIPIAFSNYVLSKLQMGISMILLLCGGHTQNAQKNPIATEGRSNYICASIHAARITP